MINCGNTKVQGTHHHPSVADVRKCFGAAPAVALATTRKSAAQVHALAPLAVENTAPHHTAPAAKGAPATDKQIAFIVRLTNERYPEANFTTDMLTGVTKAKASTTIEWLLAQPKPAPAKHVDAPVVPKVQAPEGMHKVDDTIYKVQRAIHGSGHTYAKRLVPGEGYGTKATFVYAPGALKLLNDTTKMTLEEAKAFGALYGTCCVCGRTLTNEESIAAGIGPICAGKGMWA